MHTYLKLLLAHTQDIVLAPIVAFPGHGLERDVRDERDVRHLFALLDLHLLLLFLFARDLTREGKKMILALNDGTAVTSKFLLTISDAVCATRA